MYYNINKEEFNNLTSAESNCDLAIKESIIIKTIRPELNNMNLKVF